jgi:hypothetical protein
VLSINSILRNLCAFFFEKKLCAFGAPDGFAQLTGVLAGFTPVSTLQCLLFSPRLHESVFFPFNISLKSFIILIEII